MKLTSGKSGTWMKAEQCKKGDIVLFKDEGRIEDSDKFTYEDGKPVKNFLFTVSHNGEDKTLRVNKPSRVNCIEAWGDETKSWVGKQAAVNLIPTSDGKSKMIILDPVVTEVKWE